MEFNEGAYDKIQRYLDGKLKGKDRKNFESKMKSDKNLTKEVDLHLDMEELLADTPENKLRESLLMVDQEFEEEDLEPLSSSNLSYWWILIPLLFAGIWFFINQPDATLPLSTQEVESNPQTSDTKLEEEITSTKSADIIKKPEKDTADPKEVPRSPIKKKKIIPVQPNLNKLTPAERKEVEKQMNEPIKELPPEDIPKPDTLLIAFEEAAGAAVQEIPPSSSSIVTSDDPMVADNFKSNESIEMLMDNVRSNEVEITIKEISDTLQLNETFNLIATLKSEDDLSKKKLKFYLFSNSEEAFEAFEPLSTDDVAVLPTGKNAYLLDIHKSLDLLEGLYYFLVQNDEIGKLYLVGRFVII